MKKHSTFRSPLVDKINTAVRKPDPNLRRLILITALVFLTMSLLQPKLFLSGRNFSSMAFQFPEFGIISLGVMLAMISGGIDLSAVSVANLAGIVAAMLLTRTDLPIYLIIPITMLIGVLCGLFNGFLVSKLNIPAMLATLGTGELFAGIGIVITKGRPVFGFSDEFLQIGNGSLLGIPVPLIMFSLAAVAVAVILSKSTFGFRLYMLGTNPTAAKFAGIRPTKILVGAYVLAGLLASLAGLVIIGRTNTARADYGSAYILQAVLVNVMSGVNPNGGFGTVGGVVLAVLASQMLSSGFSMARFSTLLKDLIWGALLLLIMVLNVMSDRRRSKGRT